MQTYTLKATSPEEYYAAFPAQATKIHGQPTYDDIRQLRTIIYQNAASVNSTMGGGQHGHLGMVMDATTYATISHTPWTDPPEPGATVVPQENPTQFQIAEAHRVHNQLQKARNEFLNLDRALTRIILETVEHLYLEPFHRPYVALLGQSTKEIIEQLINTYGYILPQELERNYEQLAKPYDATGEPFQILIKQFEDARTYAQDGNLPITDAQLINSGLVALKNTGVLDRFIDQWTDKIPADRNTWLQFKQHFQPRVLEYQKGRRHQNPHTQFGLMTFYPPPVSNSDASHSTLSDSYTSSMNSTFNDVINQNKESQAAMANMAATQSELLKQLADMREKYESILATQNQQATPVRRNGNLGNNTRTNKGANKDPNGYCWTHGYNVRHGHNSATCRNKAPGHKDTATRNDNMGGTQLGRPHT